MEKRKLQQLVRKYEAGRATKAERHLVDTWYHLLSDTEASHPDFDNADYRAGLSRTWMEQLPDRKAPRKVNVLPRYGWAAAAALLIAVTVPLLLFLRSPKLQSDATMVHQHVFSTAVGQVKRLTLPDSSVVFLNANAQLTVPDGYGVTHRNLILSGEAFFDITRHPELPCVLSTHTLTVSVLGTSFNVKAYPTSLHTEVAVATGRVAVHKDSLLAVLDAEERLSFHTASGQWAQSADAGSATAAWREGTTQLRDATFEELALVFENRFGVRLSSPDEQIRSGTYNLVIQHRHSVDDVLQQLSKMTHKMYRKEGNEITIY